MPQHDFTQIEAQYQSIISEMPSDFTSHQFILTLAQKNQRLYIEALHTYRNDAAPFQAVHRILSQALHKSPSLVQHRGEADSEDIWRKNNRCAAWRKV